MTKNPVLEIEQLGNLNSKDSYKKEVLNDYWICCVSREASLAGRKDVLSGKGKFGILGDGKEVPQVAMARAFKKGDFRSGYYRDQTFMFALGLCSIEEFFAQLYADAENDPFSGGRQMNNHFATPLIDENGAWTKHTETYNISSGISPTGGQMARALGLAFASKKYRQIPEADPNKIHSVNGNEVCFCTIGDASTSEGVFWESVNAACVMNVPIAISVWDDGYGISVPKEYQTTKGSISEALAGFSYEKNKGGLDIYKVKGWNYQGLVQMYLEGIEKIRTTHIPALFHIEELTQPQGHSTSGSHERYKSKERLKWEKEYDCNEVMAEWMVQNSIASEKEISEIKEKAKAYVKECKEKAWANYIKPIATEKDILSRILSNLNDTTKNSEIQKIHADLSKQREPLLYELLKTARKAKFALGNQGLDVKKELFEWINRISEVGRNRYNTYLYSEDANSAIQVPITHKQFSQESQTKTGFQVLNSFFDYALEKYPNVVAFGEDVGQIGDVNQGFAGLQDKYGEKRVFDTGIREWTIMGQAIGLAMRGFRPIAEIQYLDYLIYGLSPLSDDLATLRYRSNNIQQAPVIIRTRGHRLEGIWHAGSPIGMLLNSLRGMYIVTPRDMVQAVGFYNTLLQSNDPALVIECLNGYRLREVMPDNLGEYTVPLGVPDIITVGTDITLVTYGSCVRICQSAVELLQKANISVELIDVQTLIPFDLEETIVESVKKTNRILFVDEDFHGAATAYMMQKVLEDQKAYQYLDSAPKTLAAKSHRTPFGSDGDYFTKPQIEDIFEEAYKMMHEAVPASYPAL